MKKIYIALMMVAVCACPMLSSAGDIAAWTYSNGQPYLDIKAKDYESLGKLEGENLASQICYMKLLIMQTSQDVPGGYAQMRDWAQLYQAGIPQKYVEEMQGMVAGVAGTDCPLCAMAGGIDYTDILLQNAFIDITYGLLYPLSALPSQAGTGMGCTVLGAVNRIDDEEAVNLGQNFDFDNELAPALSFVRTKVDGVPPVFSLRMGAMLSVPAGKNAYGLSLNVTVVRAKTLAEPWASIFSGQSPPVVFPATVLARMVFEEANRPDVAYNMLLDYPLTGSYTVMMGKDSKLIAVQLLPMVGIDRNDVQDAAVLSNRYTVPGWENYLLNPEYSLKRQTYAETRLAAAYVDNTVTQEELFDTLADESSSDFDEHICRSSPPNRSGTLAIITKDHFGLRDFSAEQCFPQNLGVIPITQD